MRPIIDQLLPLLESDPLLKFNIDLSVGMMESWFKDASVVQESKQRLRNLIEVTGQVEFVRPTWTMTMDCGGAEMEADCIEGVKSARAFMS